MLASLQNYENSSVLNVYLTPQCAVKIWHDKLAVPAVASGSEHYMCYLRRLKGTSIASDHENKKIVLQTETIYCISKLSLH